MCIMAILYKATKDTPILLAANREESYERPSQPPKIQSGSPRVICGIDRQAGGTWLGINQYGMVATVANRRKMIVSPEPRSRGVLCRELLNFRSAKEAADHAAKELAKGEYAGANYVVMDGIYGAVVYGGDRVQIVELTPGLHTLGSGRLNDPNDERQQYLRRTLTLQKLDSAVTFLAVASRAFSRELDSYGRRGVVVTGAQFGTVSSSLVSLPQRIQSAVFQHAPGPPHTTPLDDLSALLRQVLSTERSRQRAQEERERKQREKAEAAAAEEEQAASPDAKKAAAGKGGTKTAAKKTATSKATPAKPTSKKSAKKATDKKSAKKGTAAKSGSTKAKKTASTTKKKSAKSGGTKKSAAKPSGKKPTSSTKAAKKKTTTKKAASKKSASKKSSGRAAEKTATKKSAKKTAKKATRKKK